MAEHYNRNNAKPKSRSSINDLTGGKYLPAADIDIGYYSASDKKQAHVEEVSQIGTKVFLLRCICMKKRGKANAVANALSRKIVGQLTSVIIVQEQLVRDFERLKLEVLAPSSQVTGRITYLMIRLTLRDRIREAQDKDPFLPKMKAEGSTDKRKEFCLNTNGALMFKGRLCVPKNENLIKENLEKAHSTLYTAHPGGMKMYHDLQDTFWWMNMKRGVWLFWKNV
ncbi:reverse transcriptase [Abeliophyllum distichum]|uniref:Reverse transcriptase n=1 Tax=Abeliophyllum distichum TaxID=126358 RepID=A0ABD1T0J5_9LAMI